MLSCLGRRLMVAFRSFVRSFVLFFVSPKMYGRF